MLKINDIARLYLGVKGENESRTLQIDMSAWASIYPNATAEILHKRQGDQTKELVDTVYDQETMILSWTPTDYDTFYEGFGIAEIRMVEGQVVKKTKDLLVTAVAPSIIDGTGEVIASDYQAWLDAVIATKNAAVTAKNAAEDSAEDAEAWAVGQRDGVDVEDTDPTYENNSKYYAEQAEASAEEAAQLIDVSDVAGAQATTLLPGSPATAEIVTVGGQKKFVFGIPKGDPGEAGGEAVKSIYMNGSEKTKDGDGKVDLGTVITSHQDVTGKANKVTGATSGNFAALDGNGDLTDSGHKHSDYLTAHQDITGKADKVDSATSGNFAGLDENGNLTDSGHKHSDYITSHQDISGKANKVAGATSGNFAALDSNGDLTDSGHKHSDYLTSHQDITGKADKVSSPTAGNFAALDENGNLTDSGHAPEEIADKLDKANVYDGVDKTAAGYALDARTGKSIYESVSSVRKGLGHQAKLTGGNWQLNSGDDAAIGEYVWVNGQLGHATAAITGGSTNIIENTNWVKETDGALNGLLDMITTLQGGVADLRSDLGIVEDTDTATHNISKGQYVIWKGELYKASAAIAIGDTLSGSNLTAVSNGGMNELLEKLSVIGTVYTGTNKTSLSVASGTETTISVVALTKGTYLIVAGFGWESASAGTLQALFFRNASSDSGAATDGSSIPGSSVRNTAAGLGGITSSFVFQVAENETRYIKLNAYQTSGSTRTAASISLKAIRVA